MTGGRLLWSITTYAEGGDQMSADEQFKALLGRVSSRQLRWLEQKGGTDGELRERVATLEAAISLWSRAKDAAEYGSCVIGPDGLCVNCSAADAYEAACGPEDAKRTLAAAERALKALAEL